MKGFKLTCFLVPALVLVLMQQRAAAQAFVNDSAKFIVFSDSASVLFAWGDFPSKKAGLSLNELKLADTIILSYLDTAAIRLPQRTYYRQYVPLINKKGEKEIWINYFCGISHVDWRRAVFKAMDGGNCFFQLKVNLRTRKCSDLHINPDE